MNQSSAASGASGPYGSPHTHTYTLPVNTWQCMFCGQNVQNGVFHNCPASSGTAPWTTITSPNTTPGYTCSQCSQWVPPGTMHSCTYAPGGPIPLRHDQEARLTALERQVGSLTSAVNSLSTMIGELQLLVRRALGHIVG